MEHKLSDILLLTICAVISGAEGWEDIEDFGETHPDFLKQYGDFENFIGYSTVDYLCRYFWCRRLGRYRGFWGNTSRFFEAIW
ncbi:transposase family protein [Escherichia coli]|uniref:transposase family protein n=1 Tax=Escherichia coli TaxID=562 RepID=UPI003D9CA64D